MISQVTGEVIHIGPTSVVVEVGGIGILTLCSPHTVAELRLGQRASLATALVVREDSLTLYGFATNDEREFFELLLTATGVGPKLAQAALAVLRPPELRQAIATANLVQLCKVPGIGNKGAQRMVVELKDKINALSLTHAPTAPADSGEVWRDQVSQGLQGLGWSAKDADAACDDVSALARHEPPATVPVLMRAALQSLARK